MKRLMAIALVVGAVMMAGCSSSSSSTTTSTTTTTTVTSSVVGTAKWVAANAGVISTLSSDVASVGTSLSGAVSSTNPSAATASCQKLATDVATAKALPPIPNSAAQQLWTSTLSGLGTASQKCIDGASKTDSGELSQASSELTSASSQLKSLSSKLGL